MNYNVELLILKMMEKNSRNKKGLSNLSGNVSDFDKLAIENFFRTAAAFTALTTDFKLFRKLTHCCRAFVDCLFNFFICHTVT